jgi:GntR family transcriptional regulator, transcriptional repressor for pyruvate dehydrogenase complex
MTDLLRPLDLSGREGTAISISRQLLDYLLSGRIQPGDRLPPERKLAEALGVGRSVVREALKSLTLLGLLEVRLGDGTYVKRMDAEILPQSIEWGLVLGVRHVVDLLEARRHLDMILAGLAALRRDERDVADLRALVSAMRAAHRDPVRFTSAHASFLRAIAEVAGNDVLAGAASTIRSLLQFWVARVPLTTDVIDAAVLEFGRVVDAISAGDGELARRAMGVAIDRLNEQVRLALPPTGQVGGPAPAERAS